MTTQKQTGSSGQRDQSVRFSLKELMKLEEERVAQQKSEGEARERAAREAKAEAERRERLETEAREHARAEEEAKRRRAESEDVARREAMQLAIVEQARVEVEARERAAERDRERRHELELRKVKMTSSSSPTMARTLLSAFVGAIVMAGFALGLHIGIAKPSSDRQIAALTQTLAAADQRAEDADRRATEQGRTIEDLRNGSREQAAEIARLKKELAAAKKPSTSPGRNNGPKSGTTQGAHSTEPSEDCDRRDPMCFTVK
jgi:colicin import membrane protein